MEINFISRDFLKGLKVNSPQTNVLIQLASAETQFENSNPMPWHATFKIVLKDDEFKSAPTTVLLKIIKALEYAMQNGFHVIVQCDAGISRSGAVAKYAHDKLGFELKDPYISDPNMKIYSDLVALHDTLDGDINGN